MVNREYELLNDEFLRNNFESINELIYKLKRELVINRLKEMKIDLNKIDLDLLIDEYILPCLV